MSKRAAQMIQDDIDGTGPMRLADVEQAQKEIIRVTRELADKGEITLGVRDEYV
jgi:flagellar motor switch protein FliG